jgi:pimeloyl-ACP methyl ester carboxylesterase
MSPEWLHTSRDGVALACLDYGGEGSSILILPGLAGHAGEWAHTASWLTERARVLVLDARGQGHSERHPGDVSPEANLADTVHLIDELGIAPVIVIGHSLGGQRAIMLAGERPDLVRGLVVADSGPGKGDDEAVDGTRDYLASWEKGFDTREAAIEHFGGPSLKAEAWADGLQERDGRLFPRWDLDVMDRSLRESFGRDFWQQWEAVRCPTLAVRSLVGESEHREMAERLPQAEFVALGHTDHDMHLYKPEEWRETLTAFLDRVDG